MASGSTGFFLRRVAALAAMAGCGTLAWTERENLLSEVSNLTQLATQVEQSNSTAVDLDANGPTKHSNHQQTLKEKNIAQSIIKHNNEWENQNKPIWACQLPLPCPSFTRSLKEEKPPNMSGDWIIDQQRSQHEEMVEILTCVGVPRYLTKMGQLSPSRMSVTQREDNSLIHETIVQLGGMYKNHVDLFMDGREVVAKQPLDGSLVTTSTCWEVFLASELEPCNINLTPEARVVCCVSYGEYKGTGHRQRIVRFLDDDGQTFHSMNTLYKADGSTITAHRLLNRV